MVYVSTCFSISITCQSFKFTEYQIEIKINNSSPPFSLTVKSTDTIATIKVKIQVVKSISPHAQLLVYCGRKLEDTKTLNFYNIKGNCCIHLIQSMCITNM